MTSKISYWIGGSVCSQILFTQSIDSILKQLSNLKLDLGFNIITTSQTISSLLNWKIIMGVNAIQ